MLYFQLLEEPGLAPALLVLLVYVIRKNYFDNVNFKFALELLAGISIGASYAGIIITTKFNTDLLALKVSNNPGGWYFFTFLELLAVIFYVIVKYRSFLHAVIMALTVVGLHEFVWFLGQGPNIGTYINFGELLWSTIVFPVPFIVLLIYKADYRIYFLPMLAYLVIGLLVPWFFSPTHNDLIGWAISCFSVCFGLKPRDFSTKKKVEVPVVST